jgi:hypothetical protein
LIFTKKASPSMIPSESRAVGSVLTFRAMTPGSGDGETGVVQLGRNGRRKNGIIFKKFFIPHLLLINAEQEKSWTHLPAGRQGPKTSPKSPS